MFLFRSLFHVISSLVRWRKIGTNCKEEEREKRMDTEGLRGTRKKRETQEGREIEREREGEIGRFVRTYSEKRMENEEVEEENRGKTERMEMKRVRASWRICTWTLPMRWGDWCALQRGLASWPRSASIRFLSVAVSSLPLHSLWLAGWLAGSIVANANFLNKVLPRH